MIESQQTLSPMRIDTPEMPASQVRTQVRTLADLRGPAGRLEAIYTPGRPEARHAAVVCHPHPLFGGTMHNKVVYHAAKVLQQAGMPVLRFNFRGAGASEGTHDSGEGEQEDLRAVMAWLADETALPLVVAGFSFGAYVSLRTCCAGHAPNVHGLIALGLPIQAGDRGYAYDFLSGCTLPKLFVSGSADAFGPLDAIKSALDQARPPTELVWVPGADHFFQGTGTGLAEMQTAVASWLARHFGPEMGNEAQRCE